MAGLEFKSPPFGEWRAFNVTVRKILRATNSCDIINIIMNTITIPKSLIKNDDLVIIPRLEYEGLLKRILVVEDNENTLKHLWKSAAKDKFFKSYSKSDEIYDQI